MLAFGVEVDEAVGEVRAGRFTSLDDLGMQGFAFWEVLDLGVLKNLIEKRLI